jgi:RNase H-fold protein (predicted Holliday junction resolvase)
MLQDERMTTKNATESLKYSMGLKCSKIKKIKDKMSAYLILEEYLSASNKHRKE